MEFIRDIAALEALYGQPGPAARVKVARRITPEYRAWIEAAPFAALATVGPEGVDVSPRGDRGQVVHVMDDTTLALPDRRGNDRIDSLRNIVRDGRVSLMLVVPGSGNVIRVIGTGRLTADAALLDRFAVEGARPRSVLLVEIGEVYFQCARAVMRAGLWDGTPAPELPTPGTILAAMSEGRVGGAEYDGGWAARARETMW